MKVLTVFRLFLFLIVSLPIVAQGQVTVKVLDRDGGRPVAGAKVKISSPKVRSIIDFQGRSNEEGTINLENVEENKIYLMVVEKETYRSLEKELSFTGGRMEVVELSSDVSIVDQAEPEDVISREDLQYAAHYSLGQLLHYMIPSFHSTPQTIADGTDHLAPASLRGLGPDQVLLLVNGKRRHSSSLVNVNGTVGRGSVSTDYDAIPVSAIERIEIYRAGAATRFGSDAIAGVINVILREDEAISIGVQGGFTNGGSNNSEFASFFGDGERLFAHAGAGFGFGQGGSVRITGEYLHRGAINRSGNYAGPVYIDGDTIADRALQEVKNFFGQGQLEDLAGRRVMRVGQALTNDARVIVNARIPLYLGEAINGHAYAIGNLNLRNGVSSGFYRFPYQQERIASDTLYPNGFLPTINSFIRDGYYTVGVRGRKGEWLFDFSNTQGDNTFDFNITESNNASLGFQSPTSFYSGGFRYRQNTSQVDFSRDFNKRSDWEVTLRSGLAFRYEGYRIEAGEEASYIQLDSNKVGGAQVFPGFRPSSEVLAQRTNSGVYGGINISRPLANDTRFFVSVFGRYENYSDFGGAGTFKAAMKFDFVSWLKLRASFNQGFRAPSLHQTYFNSVSTQITSSGTKQVGTFNNQSVVARRFGIEPLTQERSNGYNLGLTGSVIQRKRQNLLYYVDFYWIAISDRIILSGQFDALQNGEPTAYFDILNPLGVNSAQFFTNALGTSTQGLDFMLNYRQSWDGFSFKGSVGGNVVLRNEVNKNEDGTVSIGLMGFDTPEALDALFSREEIARLETGQPNYKIILQLLVEKAYNSGKLFGRLHNTSFGQVTYLGRSDAFDQAFSEKPFVTDIEAGFSFNQGSRGRLSLSLGCHNIWNVYPDENISVNTEQGVFTYSRRVQQFGVAGRSLYLRVGLNLADAKNE